MHRIDLTQGAVLEKGWLSKDDLDRILSPENLTEPRPPVRA